MTLLIKVSKRAKRPFLTYKNKDLSLVWPHRLGTKRLSLFLTEKRQWIEKSTQKLLHAQKETSKLLSQKILTPEEALWAKQETHTLLEKIIPIYTSRCDVTYSQLTVRTMTTRWGSCSSKKRLTFSTKFAYLPENLRHYLVAHEICHLRHMNHGPNFWKLLTEMRPEARQEAKLLREYKIPSNID